MRNTSARTDNDGHPEGYDEDVYILRLFITGASPNSVRAVENLKAFCEAHLKSRYSLEIIDVYQQPELALTEQLIALPLLIVKSAGPVRRLIGDMSDEARIFRGLGLQQS